MRGSTPVPFDEIARADQKPAAPSRFQRELAQKEAEIADFERKLDEGAFGGGRAASLAGEQLASLRRQREDILNKIETGREVKTTARDVGREVVNAPFRGVVNTTLGSVAGGLDLFGLDDVAQTVRTYRDEVTEKYKAPEAASQNELLRLGGAYGEGLGSTAPFLAGGLPVRGAKLATGAMAGGLGADEQDARVKAAREQGIIVTPGQEVASEWLGAGIGLTELAPVPAMVGRGLGGRLFDKVTDKASSTVTGRIAGAAIEEGLQEAGAGVAQDLIERGVYNENAKVGDNALGDFLLGGAVGGTVRGGVEIVDKTTGRLRKRAPEDRRLPPPGRVESAFEANATPTQDDMDSPLDTGDIAAGRAGIAVAQAENEVSREFEAMGLPEVGAQVILNDPETGAVRGTLRDRFTAEDGTGVVIDLEDGTTLREYDDVLADVGITITAADGAQPRTSAAPQYPTNEAGHLTRENGSPILFKTRREAAEYATANQLGGDFDVAPIERRGFLGRNVEGFALQQRTRAGASPLAEADAIDAQLAARAQAGRQPSAQGPGQSSPTEPVQAAPSSPASDTKPTPSGPVSDGGAIIRSIFGDKARITSGYRGPDHPLSKKNPRSWHARSKAAVDMAPIPGMTFEQAKAAIEAQGYTLIEAINEVGKGRTKHATGDHWHFVIGGGGAAPAGGGGLGMAMPERQRDPTVTIDDESPRDGPAKLDMPTREREPIATRGKQPAKGGVERFDVDERDTAVTVTGREIGVKYRLAELDDLIASNTPDGAVNPNYPQERQPRDRSRAASLSQVENIAGNLNPRLLGRSPKAADGAPIISPDGVVESGNGRTLALQKVYAADGDKAQAYRAFLEAEGYNTEGMSKPVLVRVRDGNLAEEDVQAFVREANARDTAGMSGTETASSDASALPGGLLDLYRGGDIDAAGNRDFVRGFMQALVPENDRATLVLKDGSIAGSLVKRIEAALLVRAIGPRAFIEKLVDADGDNIKSIGKALVDVSGPLAKLREAVKSGAVDPAMDISDNIAEAVEIVERARREKRNVADLVNQRDVFSGETVAPLTEAVLHLFFNGPRFTRAAGRERIAERLGYYIEQAEKAAPGGGLFGESTKAQPGDILGLANARSKDPADADQGDLLARAREGERDGSDGADVRPDGRDGGEQRGESALPQSGDEGTSESVEPAGAEPTRQTFGKGNFLETDADGNLSYEVNGFAGGTGSAASVRKTLENALTTGNSAMTDANRKAIERMLEALPGSAPTPPASTAPEHATIGVDDRELSEVVQEFDAAAASENGVTKVFAAPEKKDIVRLADKAKVYREGNGWMTVEQAKAEIAKWKRHAQAQGAGGKARSVNSQKVVLSLFDLSGQWSKPWREAGYDVYQFDIQAEFADFGDGVNPGDVHNFSAEFMADWFGSFEGREIHAILAACPCTDFASSGARHFAAKDADGRTVSSVRLVQQTLATIEYFKPAVWAVENPVGRIEKLGGLPPWRLSFDPNHVGEPYTKKTLIWGRFNADLPIAPVEPTEGSKMWSQYGGKSLATKNARSVTPEGFAYAFFMANNAYDHPAMTVANQFDRLDRGLIEQAIEQGITPEAITEAVEDPYYSELDDEAAEAAIRELMDGGAPQGGEPVSKSYTLTETPSGKGIAVTYGSTEQLEQVERLVPEAKASKRADGAYVYSKKHRAAIENVLEATQGATETVTLETPAGRTVGGGLPRATSTDELLREASADLPEGYRLETDREGSIVLMGPSGMVTAPSGGKWGAPGLSDPKQIRSIAAKAKARAKSIEAQLERARKSAEPERPRDRSVAIVMDPAKGTVKSYPAGSQRPTEAELSRRSWMQDFTAAGERMRERLDAVDPNNLRPMLEAMAEGRPIVGDGDVIETLNPHRAYELGYIKLDVDERGTRSFSITDTGRDFLSGKKTVAGKGVIGQNARGQDVFEDENGVRSIVEDGIRLTESVGMVPTREGVRMTVDVSNRDERYKTTSEIGERRAQVEQEAKKLVARAEATKLNLDRLLANVAGEYKPGPLKTVDRIVAKVMNEGYNAPSDLKDIARGTIIVDSMEEAEAAIARVLELNVVEDKGWKALESFYLDRKFIVSLAGIKAEIAIVPRAIWNAAKRDGARQYFKEARGDFGAVTVERKAELLQLQRDAYSDALEGSAFEGLLNDAKSASGYSRSAASRESGAPGLANNPGADAQTESSRQTSAEGTGSSNVATSRPSTSLNEGLSISDDVSSTEDARKGINPSKNRLVTDERAAELRERLKAKLNPNRLNAGIDPEILAIGTELAVYHIEKGARRFTALARAIASDLGADLDSLRKYLRGWYNGARDMMEDSGESVAGMDDADEVGRAMRTFADWANDATIPSDADVSERLPTGDERPGTEDGARASQDGGAERAPRQEDLGSAGSLFDADQGRADRAGQRSSSGPASGSTGDRAGVRDADGVSEGRTGARRERTGTPASAVTGRDWLIEPGSLAESRSPAQKARDNLEAIRTVKRVKAEGRPATREEQALIARYVGWGGLKNAFPDTQGQYGKGFEEVGPALRDLLTDSEYETARRSIQYAHYTGETIVRAMWDMAYRLGFRGGQVFEPGMGTGNFRGMMRPDLLGSTSYSGIEYDHLTADIASLLYPQSGVRQADYTDTPMMRNVADLVIGNPPFSETTVGSDRDLGKHRFVLHDFFFAKSIEAVKPGGLLMFVTSAGTMNKVNTKGRQYLADRADLVGAIRLPGNAFKENAGTEVTTDIIILRKREPGAEASGPSWLLSQPTKLPDRDGNTVDGNVNEYFLENPDMVLGEAGMFDKLVAGVRYAVRAPAGFDLSAALEQAIDRLPVVETTNAPTGQSPAAEAFDLNVTERKEGSFYVGDGGKLMQLRGGAGVEVKAPGKGVTGGISKANQERIKKLIPIRDSLREVYAADLAENDAEAAEARKRLNAAYDAFVKEFGPINKTDTTARAPSVVQIESARAQAREEARLSGAEWEEGSFDIEPFLESKASLAEIARARKAAREEALDAGRTWDEGSFDPEEVPDTIIEKRPNLDAFMADEEAYRLAAIESYDKETGKAAKGRIFTQSAVRLDKEPEIAGAEDALLYSLNRFGRPDLGFIAEKAGLSEDEVLDKLADRLFEVPGAPGTYETAEVYLSGNVRDKLAIAQEAAKSNSSLARNVRALEAVQPAPLAPSEIHAKLGMPWIPPQVVEQFATERLGLRALTAKYVPAIAQWSAAGDSYSSASTTEWGTDRYAATALIEAALNRQTPKVYDRTSDGNRVFNEVATQAAQDKMNAIKAAFSEWIWTDEARTAELVELYNEKYNSLVAPQFDGSYLTTPGINPQWRWRPHQSSVIARIIQTGNTYMAHEVGSGKTSAMIGAGMEMRRLGLVNKPMYVVPNHMLGQFTKEFYEQYPLAKIRVADETRFHTSRRKEFIASIAADDLDAVIITHSAFGYIPMSEAFTDRMIEEQIVELETVLAEVGDDRVTRRNIEQRKEALEQKIKGKSKKGDQVFTFEETGVDFLFVDEAHLFRKLDYATKMGNVKGIDPNGSAMSFDLFAKTRYLEKKNPGRNLVLASGTPITNTMAELFSVSRYLQEGELSRRGLSHFDAWAGAYGDTVTSLEQDPAGGYKPITRFAQFVNVPELSVMVRQVMDVVSAQDLRKYVTLPELKGGQRQTVIVEQTDLQSDYQFTLKMRMEAIEARKGPPQKGDDILLSVIGDGRKAAIDYRLVSPDAKREPGSKLETMIDNVFERWEAFEDVTFHEPLPPGQGYSKDVAFRGPATQMIFSDFGINGDFPVHKYIKQTLIARGVPANQIALIADYKTHVAKQRLFNDMNDGKVRILIGSVAKMGTGVNAQKRLRAVHNMDPQWYPANDTQRNGRIIRQGNMNPEVEILDYSTKGTYDSQMWNLMAKKAKFIEGFMRGDPNMRDMEDLGEASQYEQAQAMTTSDPRVMELTEWKQELEQVQRRKAAHEREQHTLRKDIELSKLRLQEASALIPLIEQDIAARNVPPSDAFTATLEGETFSERVPFGEAIQIALSDLVKTAKGKAANRTIGEYAGFRLEGATKPGIDGPTREVRIMRAGKRYSSVQVSEDPSGMVSRLTNALSKFDGELEEEQRVAQRAEDRIADYTPKLGKTFDDGGKMDELRGKITALEATLQKETEDRKKARESKDSIPEDDLFSAPQPERSMTQRQRAELEARQKQGMARRGGQQGLGDQEGGLFSSERDQGSLFSRIDAIEPEFIIEGVSLPERRVKATQWYNRNLVGRTVTMKDGRKVQFTKRGADKTTAHKGDRLLAAVPAIRRIIETGDVIATVPGNRPGVNAAMWVGAPVRMPDGEVRNLAVMVREQGNGVWQYAITDKQFGKGTGLHSAPGGMEAGLNLRVVGEDFAPGQVERPTVSDEALRAQLAKLGLRDKVVMQIVDTLGGRSAGRYTPGQEALIQIARDTAQSEDFTLNHEAVHALRELGVFKDSEWKILVARAKREPGLWRSIERRYRKLDKDGREEEAVADLFAKFQRGDFEARGVVAKAFKMLRGVLEAIGNAVRLRGFRTAEGVMRDMASGRMAARDGRGLGRDMDRDMVGYHGGPHDHDGFDTAYIGSGEGAQVYGWGLYFASRREVAEWYRKALTKMMPVKVRFQGKTWLQWKEHFEEINDWSAASWDLLQGIAAVEDAGSLDAAIEQRDKLVARFPTKANLAVLDWLDRNRRGIEVEKAGRLYQVEIPEAHEYLDWHKPIMEQPAHIRDALRGLMDRYGIPYTNDARRSGSAIYEAISADLAKRNGRSDGDEGNGWSMVNPTVHKDDRAASLLLLERGIKGIKYLDGMSRRAGDGDHYNYVVFDGADVVITAKESIVDDALDRAGFPLDDYANAYDVSGPGGFDRRSLSLNAARRQILTAMSPTEYEGYYADVMRWTGEPATFGSVKVGFAQQRDSIPETDDVLAEAGTEPTWKDRMGDKFDRWRTAMQDRYLPLLRVQQAIEKQTGRALPEDMNPYLGEELMSGRIGARLETLMEGHVRPLFDAMADEKITTDELETYLYARHAPERNARIAEINPEFDGENGSGMSNLEARAVMARIRRDGKMEAMERLADRVDRMRDMALDYRVETGLMSQEDADAWRATYEYYVPLRGFKEVEGDPASLERINRSGGGINVRGKESRAAYGRRSQADSPLAYTILQAEEAIVRGETNRTAQRFIKLARANPDENLWEVNKVTGRRQMNPDTGLVESYMVNQLTAEDKDWTVSAKFDGKEVRVTMNRSNPTARRLADSMRNLTQHQLDWVTEYLGKLNRFLSRVNTSYNPEFVISNAMRDIQTATVNLTGEERDGLVAGTLKDYPSALKAATQGAFNRGSGEWSQWYNEFINEGGRVYFNQVEDIGLIKKRIEREAQLAGADKPGTKRAQAALHAKRLFFAAGDMIESMNLGVENAVRLAAYKNARERGMSKQAAASLAKNLTVNFNRRGTFGPAMNAAYLFYNASVQGTVRLLTALRSKRARRLLYGVMASGAAVEMLNAMVSGYDDDEESYYDKIPHYEKERNLIIMMPGSKQYVKIPLPYGYNVFWEGGRTAAEIARRGGKSWQESAFNLFLTAANSFNPVGGADSLINLVAPTVMDPIVDLEMNEDFTGAPIMPEQNPFDSPEPDHNRYFSSVEPHWKEVAHTLNKLSGGDDVVPGSVSVSPETLEYLFGYTVGGAGRFVERVGGLPAKLVDPDHETTVNDFPFARRMVGEVSPWLDKGLYYDRIAQVDQAIDYTKDYLEREQFDQAAGFAERNEKILELEPVMKAAQKEMRKIRKARRANEGAYELGKIDEAAYRAEKKVIDQAETMVITDFNTQWNRSVGFGRDEAAGE